MNPISSNKLSIKRPKTNESSQKKELPIRLISVIFSYLKPTEKMGVSRYFFDQEAFRFLKFSNRVAKGKMTSEDFYSKDEEPCALVLPKEDDIFLVHCHGNIRKLLTKENELKVAKYGPHVLKGAYNSEFLFTSVERRYHKTGVPKQLQVLNLNFSAKKNLVAALPIHESDSITFMDGNHLHLAFVSQRDNQYRVTVWFWKKNEVIFHTNLTSQTTAFKMEGRELILADNSGVVRVINYFNKEVSAWKIERLIGAKKIEIQGHRFIFITKADHLVVWDYKANKQVFEYQTPTLSFACSANFLAIRNKHPIKKDVTERSGAKRTATFSSLTIISINDQKILNHLFYPASYRFYYGTTESIFIDISNFRITLFQYSRPTKEFSLYRWSFTH